MTKEEIKTLLMVIKTVYPTLNVTPTVIEVWHGILHELPFLDAQEALNGYLKSSAEFPPRPGQIYQRVASKRNITSLITAGEAWEKCCKGASKGWDFEKFAEENEENPRLVSAARQTSWHRIRYADFSELDFVRNAFVSFYTSMAERDEEVRSITNTLPDKQVEGLVNGLVKKLTLVEGAQ